MKLLLSLALLVAVAGCSKSPPATTVNAADSTSAVVHVAPVIAVELPLLAELTGTVRPVRRATLAAKVMGAITAMPLGLGQRVQAGEHLLTISAAEISARVAQAQAQLNIVQRDLARERELLTLGASTTDTVRGLEDRFALTAAMVREAETMLGYTELRAPFAGVIARKFVQAGDLAAPGQPLVELESADAFQIEAGIPDSLAAHLVLGSSFLIEAPAEQASFSAELAELSSAADAFAHTVLAKFAVPATAKVRSGQFVRVHVATGTTRALLVPEAALSRNGQIERVFVVEAGRAVLRLVKSGASHHGRLEILSGLSEGETVIVSPPAGLREGQKIEVRS
ncbi:MAG: efflux RND transporter periplasmic adaptor subunit [Candidatus Didemnitutus sp.]|nr:efflux RND transporter periplasmic adaptor subunit [Candidatus Didemnitutus sp.]